MLTTIANPAGLMLLFVAVTPTSLERIYDEINLESCLSKSCKQQLRYSNLECDGCQRLYCLSLSLLTMACQPNWYITIQHPTRYQLTWSPVIYHTSPAIKTFLHASTWFPSSARVCLSSISVQLCATDNSSVSVLSKLMTLNWSVRKTLSAY